MAGIGSATSGSISTPGVGSGIPIEDLVAKLVAAERAPAQTQIDRQRKDITTQTSALGSLKSLLSAVKSSLASLVDGSAFTRRTASSSNAEMLTASANAKAVPGSYQIEVLAVAAAQKVSSSAFAAGASVGTGTLTIEVGASSLDIEIGAGNNTLAGIRDAINNAAGNPGVRASIVRAEDGEHLVLTSARTGVENAFSVRAAGGDGGLDVLTFDAASASGNMSLSAAAADTRVLVDGLAVTAPGNVIDGAIDGVTLSINKLVPGETSTVTVGADTGGMKNLVKTFVDTYNNFIKGAATLAGYNEETRAAGPLLGDATLRSVRTQLATVLTGMGGGSDAAFRTLGEVGIKLQADGTLKLDEGALSSALDDNPQGMRTLFGGSAGIGTRLESLLGGYLDRGGVLDARTDSLAVRAKRLDQQLERLDRRMQSVEARYFTQFNAMDTMLAQMQNTSQFLASQLEALASIYKPSNR